MTTESLILIAAMLAQLPAPPPAPPVELDEPEQARLVLFLLLDDSEKSRGVDGAIIRRVTLPPYNACDFEECELRILRYQGFHGDAPAWRIGYTGDWTPILDWCPCGGVWNELAYYVDVHRERLMPGVRRTSRFGLWVKRQRRWPVPPTRAIIVRDFIAWRVWTYRP